MRSFAKLSAFAVCAFAVVIGACGNDYEEDDANPRGSINGACFTNSTCTTA